MKKKIFLAIFIFFLSMIGGWVGYYQNKIHSGIQIAGLYVGGMEKDKAETAISGSFNQMNKLSLVWGGREWSINPVSIGWSYDIKKTIEAAYHVGRDGNVSSNINNVILAKRNGWIMDPVFVIDERLLNEAIATIAAEINIPAKEPEISYDSNNGVVNITPGENGQAIDTRMLSQRILLAVKSLNNKDIEIPVMQLSPKLNESQILNAKKRAQGLVGKKLEIKNNEDGQIWLIDDAQILAWMDPQSNGWKEQSIDNWVNELAKTVDRAAENANFRVVGDGKVEEFRPGIQGLRIKQVEMRKLILTSLTAIETGQQEKISLIMEVTEPEVKTGDANNLGIKELIGKGESWFSGSIDNRIFNIKKATEAINGILVAPGETFSFNEKIGEVSQATGYKSAYIIKDGKTVLGDGGGVCQVSSTLFRAVLHAGLPITERLAHAYRVSYYEEKSEPGFDATVFQPSPDFKFKNDTGTYILIQTLFDEKNKHVVFDIYGTSDGRQVTVSKARTWEVIPPPPALYQDDATKPVGYLVQIEHPAWGAKVAFDWKVVRGGEVLQDRTFYSNYAPWQAVYIRGTKQ